MEQRRAVVQVERPVFVLFDKLQRRLNRPFGIVMIERLLQVAPIDVLGPRESFVSEEASIPALVVPKCGGRPCVCRRILGDISQTQLLVLFESFDVGPDVEFPDVACRVAASLQARADGQVVVFEFAVKGRKTLLSRRALIFISPAI